jgi:diaminopimelate epimerase
VKIPFVKAHGARNDFLLTWSDQVPTEAENLAELAQAICDRHVGIGADGWIIVSKTPDADAKIQLWNSDGSHSEISGNGTRCAAALLVSQGLTKGPEITILTGAGLKYLRLLEQAGSSFSFEMNMGEPTVEELNATVAAGRDAVILDVGNPQLAILSEDFDFDWRELGAEMEQHPYFPNRTNVSFVRVVDDHTLDVRFFERGAGETMSSGTGSTGAAAAAVARGLVQSPIRILTPAGPLEIRREGNDFLLAGPAEISASGEFYYDKKLAPRQ